MVYPLDHDAPPKKNFMNVGHDIKMPGMSLNTKHDCYDQFRRLSWFGFDFNCFFLFFFIHLGYSFNDIVLFRFVTFPLRNTSACRNQILRPGIAICLKFTDSSIICVWTYKKLIWIPIVSWLVCPKEVKTTQWYLQCLLLLTRFRFVQFFEEYDKYLSKPSGSARTIRVFDHLWITVK